MSLFRTLAACVCITAVVGSVHAESASTDQSDLQIVNSRIPSGAPPAAFQPPPALPTIDAWPFPEGAPRTSGTGRYAHGAFYWTDFLYDATGAKGPNAPVYRAGTPSGGTMIYPDAPQAGNGADLFRIGIARDAEATYWRVDWQTLTSVDVPIAAFALDFRAGGILPFPAGHWPGVPRLGSEGVDAVLLISANGYRLLNAQGIALASGEVAADLESRSFVARVPHSAWSPDFSAPWTVRLAAGLNDGQGNFRDTMADFMGLASQPPVFNLGFRDYQDEPAANNTWFNETQAQSLAVSDANPFAVELDWGRMGETEPEPLGHGYFNRWYVSSLGPGVFGRAGVDTEPAAVTGDPVYFDRVQPYGIYIPEGYDFANPYPVPLTLMLHSLTQNHNQYGATVPHFQRDGCEVRNSICLTTLGRGPAGSYQNHAEVDLWEAWHDVASQFALDPDRTISSGYSMGANGTIRLLIKYPDVFAAGVVLAGSQDNEPGISQLENIKWNGYYHAHGTFDELIPFPEARATIDRIKALGYRYTFDHYLAEDHIVWTLKDEAYSAFAAAADWMTNTAPMTRKRNPGEIIYRWRSSDIDAALGIGPVGPWWIGGLATSEEGIVPRVHAVSAGRPERRIENVVFVNNIALDFDTPSPRLREQQAWALGEAPPAGGLLTLELNDVSQLSVDLLGAGIAERGDKLIRLSTNRPLDLTLTGLSNGTKVRYGGVQQVVTNGEITLSVVTGDDQAVAFK